MGRHITDKKLDDLEAAVSRLVEVFTFELDELRTQVNAIEARELRLDLVNAQTVEEELTLASLLADLKRRENVAVAEAEAEPDYDGRDDALGAGEDDLDPYELVFSKTLYVSGDDAFDVAGKLLLAARDVRTDATFLTLAAEYIPAGDDGEPAYFSGNVTVGV